MGRPIVCAALFKFDDDLRRLFVNQLIFNMLVDSLTLLNKHKSVNGNFKRIVISSSLSVITWLKAGRKALMRLLQPTGWIVEYNSSSF